MSLNLIKNTIMMKKDFYVAPESEVLALHLEGVIAVSGNLNDWEQVTPSGAFE